jgi:hypothetical protein
MMILGYLIGQKFYPIPYNLKKFFGYVGLALLLYVISEWINPGLLLARFSLSFVLLAVFLWLVWLVERPSVVKTR